MNVPYKDSKNSINDRVADLLARMSREEKLAQIHALWLILDAEGQHQLRQDSFAGIKSEGWQARLANGLGQITRPLGSHGVAPKDGVRALNSLQRYLVENTRLGIPALPHEECLVGVMCRGGTLFPGSLNSGATWQPDLIEAAANAIGKEARSIGCRQGLAPVLDVSRDVRWGRTEETFGEDPYLVGVMGTRYVQGLQGEQRDLLATLKHFVGHSFSEGARNHAPVHVGERELNDVFLLPFEMAIKQANAGSVMPAYHDIDGQPTHSDYRLMTELLRDQWGFDGLIVADYIGVSLLYQHHGTAKDAQDAAHQAFTAGLDVELPGDDCVGKLDPNDQNALPDAILDACVTRVLTEKFRLGLFEQPYTDVNAISFQQPETLSLARQIASQSLVLLENDGILPLAEDQHQTIAVIGPTAADPLAHLSGYSFPVHALLEEAQESVAQVVTPLQALQQRYGDKVVYAKGCDILTSPRMGTAVFPGDVEDSASVHVPSPVCYDDSAIADAVACARQADIALLCLGDLPGLFQSGTVGEGSDTDTLDLPGVQQALLEAVVATGTPVVVILSGGRPYSLGGLEEQVSAFMLSFSGGQEIGNALVDVLSGKVNPSGRLPISVPKSAGAMPYFYNHHFKSSGTPVAQSFGAKYPFGYGLGYSRFAYRDLHIATEALAITDELVAQVTVENTSGVDGEEVVQLYVRDVLAKRVRPTKELKAFCKVKVPAGEVVTVTLTVPVDMLNYTDQPWERVVEPGDFEIAVGSSSQHLPLKGHITVLGNKPRVLPKMWKMESTATVKSQ
tara:strand:- start:85 stop:2457 length:2373 start_codon:yes stop_codon:yes gene_type:complete